MWTTAAKTIAPFLQGATKNFDELERGEIFSLNAKARRLVLDMIDTKSNELFVRVLANGQLGDSVTLPYDAYRGRPIVTRGTMDAMDQPDAPQFNLYDRVKCKAHDMCGTVVDTNHHTPPAWDLIVLLDSYVDGQRLLEVRVSDCEHEGEQAEGESMVLARKAHAVVRSLPYDYEQHHERQARAVVQEELSKIQAKRADYAKAMDQQQDRAVQELVHNATAQFAKEFKTIVEAGVLAVTAGEHNYELDVCAELADSYMESIIHRVRQISHNENINLAASIEIMKLLASLMEDGYFLTRLGYVRKHKGRWGTFSKKGNTLGMHPTKEKAQRQLRAIEMNKRHGYDEASE